MFGLKITNKIIMLKKKTYDEWWDSPVECTTQKGIWVTTNGDPVTHGMYVLDYYTKLRNMLVEQGADIIDEKRFKYEIAKMIYTLSDDSLCLNDI